MTFVKYILFLHAFVPYSGLYNGQHRGYAFDIVRAAYAAVNCQPSLKSAPYGLYVSFSRGMGEKAQRAADLLDRGLSLITINGTYKTIEATWDEWLENGLTAGEPAPLWQLNG